MNTQALKYQSGVTLIAAIFLLVGLSMLGALITLLVSSQSESTLNELFSVQALYAAESGIQASAFYINQSAISGGGTANCDSGDITTPVQLESGKEAWYSVQSTYQVIGSVGVCSIVATGMAGGSYTNPIAQRQVTVIYNSATLP